MEFFRRFLPYLIPILALQLILIVVALLDLRHRERTRGPKWMWVLVILLGNLLGPVLYLSVGRPEE